MLGIVSLYIIYGVVLLAGGVIGYAKAKSTPSLFAGIISSALAAGAAALLILGHSHSGLELGVALSLMMEALFFDRLRRTKKAMPAIPIIVLSVLVQFLSLFRLFAAPGRHA